MALFRKIIHISAEDSPNVRYGLAQQRQGIEPTGEVLVPGVLPWNDYVVRRRLWDPIRQCIGLDGHFYIGAENLLFPPNWLNNAERVHANLGIPLTHRKAEAVGIDPAEGGDKTAMCAVDKWGVIEITSRRTPNTADVPNEAIAFVQKWQCPWEKVVFDRGGGGKQAADTIRSRGEQYEGVRTVAFGEPLLQELHRGRVLLRERIETREDRTTYKNRRAQMYHEASILLDPANKDDRGLTLGFGIPAMGSIYGAPIDQETNLDPYGELRRQLAYFPRMYDEEGRLWLPPKNKKDQNSRIKTLVEVIGRSPDEADAFVLAVHGLLHAVRRAVAGAV
jgi:hypothetical protein